MDATAWYEIGVKLVDNQEDSNVWLRVQRWYFVHWRVSG